MSAPSTRSPLTSRLSTPAFRERLALILQRQIEHRLFPAAPPEEFLKRMRGLRDSTWHLFMTIGRVAVFERIRMTARIYSAIETIEMHSVMEGNARVNALLRQFANGAMTPETLLADPEIAELVERYASPDDLRHASTLSATLGTPSPSRSAMPRAAMGGNLVPFR